MNGITWALLLHFRIFQPLQALIGAAPRVFLLSAEAPAAPASATWRRCCAILVLLLGAAIVSVGAQAPSATWRRCYAPPAYLVPETNLTIDLGGSNTTVRAWLTLVPNPAHASWAASAEAASAAADGCMAAQTAQAHIGRPHPLYLDGYGLKLLSLSLNGRVLGSSDYRLSRSGLMLHTPPQTPFVLASTVVITPLDAAVGSGLLKTRDNTFVTQCETTGFARISYHMDRPDVLSRYSSVLLRADAAATPVLLSNGNLVAAGQLHAGRHYTLWTDPWPKPTYLFAAVAGRLRSTAQQYIAPGTRRTTALRAYAPQGYEQQLGLAMETLRRVMTWDEARFNRSYDLATYSMVGLQGFITEGMENKGLATFKLQLLAYHPDTHTDDDADTIRALVAHEYLHNWSGNRVTVRDWFELGLKEGLTSLREQLFMADVDTAAAAATAATAAAPPPALRRNAGTDVVDALLASASPASQIAATSGSSWRRVQDATRMRSFQFAEAAGLGAHAVRPSSYVRPDALYDYTTYSKGAEICRMYHTLLGPQRYAAAVMRYFDSHDGQAVTFEALHAAMQATAGTSVQLSPLLHWLDVAPTPRLLVGFDQYDAASGLLRLYASVTWPGGKTPGPAARLVLVPVKVGILDSTGQELHCTVINQGGGGGLGSASHTEAQQQGGEVGLPQLLRPGGEAHCALPLSSKQSAGAAAGAAASDGSLVLLVDSSGGGQAHFMLRLSASAAAAAAAAVNSSSSSNSNAEDTVASAASPLFGAVSWLRDFSAPVLLEVQQPANPKAAAAAELLLARHDPNLFARWDACRRLMGRALQQLYLASLNAAKAAASAAGRDPASAVGSAADEQYTAAAAMVALVQSPHHHQASGSIASNSSDSSSSSNSSSSSDSSSSSSNSSSSPSFSTSLNSSADVSPDWLVQALAEAIGEALQDASLDGRYKALLLKPPTTWEQQQLQLGDVRPLLLSQARRALMRALATALRERLSAAIAASDAALAAKLPDSDSSGRERVRGGGGQRFAAITGAASEVPAQARALRGAALLLLSQTGDQHVPTQLAARYRAGTCLTDRLAALHSLAASPHLLQQELEHFATTYAGRPAALQHWLKLQASLDEPQPAGDGSTAGAAAQSTGSTAGPQPGSAAAVRALLHHRAFAAADAEAWDALMSAFAGNEHSFHAADGSGYELVADAVLQVDKLNSQVAAKLLALLSWRHLARPHAVLMCSALKRVAEARSSLSTSVGDAAVSAAAQCSSSSSPSGGGGG